MISHLKYNSTSKLTGVLLKFGLPFILLLILFLHISYYFPFISDDAFISLRYAQRLLQGKGLTWTEGIPVEGYSNLLWLLLVALLGALKYNLVDSTRILGFIGMSMVLFANMRLYSPDIYPKKVFPFVIGQLCFVLSGPIAVWTIGGLEQPLVAGFLAWTIVLSFDLLTDNIPKGKVILLTSLCLGLLSISRLDGPIFTITTLLAIIITKGVKYESFMLCLKIIFFPILLYGSQIVFRLIYYHEWIPNTALVKISPSISHYWDGLLYLKEGFLSLSPFSFLALIFLIVMFATHQKERDKAILLTIVGGIWSAYIIFIGGDIFPAFRHFIPIIVILVFVITEGAILYWQRLQSFKAKALFIIFILSLYGYYMYNQFSHEQNKRALEETSWVWDGQVIGLFLKQAFGKAQPLLAANVAGCLPYWSELPAIDMLGLNDYYLPRHPPQNFGEGSIGHELGDGLYVLNRQPDLINFCGVPGIWGACFKSGREMQQLPQFYKLYTPVKFRGDTPYTVFSLIWVRRDSEKIGIQCSANTTTIPGFLFNGNPDTVTYLNEQGEVVIPISASNSASIKRLFLPKYPVIIKTIPVDPALTVEVQHGDDATYEIMLRTISTTPIEINKVIIEH